MRKAFTFKELMVTIFILGGLVAFFAPQVESTSSSTHKYDPYADKNCSEQYKTFMKRNETQYNSQGQVIRTNTGSLPHEARQILRECRDTLGGLDNSRVSILRNFAFQN